MDELLRATYEAEQRHFWYRGFRRFVRPFVADAVAGREAPRLLDAGCGTGGNLGLLAEFGRAFGFDVTWTGLRFATARGRRPVACARAGAIPFRAAIFDVVTSFDVLYCLEEPEEQSAVAEMFRVLRPGGAMVINVAAMTLLHGNHSVFDGEVRRYTRRRLRPHLERAGFEIIRMTHTNASLFLPMLIIRSWQRYRGLAPPGAAHSDFGRPSAVVNTVLSAVLAIEAGAIRWVDLPLGSSILCLARKPEDPPG
jgi:SAM-dependent methyltransferase